jgi:hypothetical protein
MNAQLRTGDRVLAPHRLVGFPFNSARSYAGFRFTAGLALITAVLGLLLIRAAAVGAPRRGRSISKRGAEHTPTGSHSE